MGKIFISMIIVLSITFVGCSNSTTPNNSMQTTSYETIDIEEIEDYVAEGYMLVDVREVEEFEGGHIPDAINVPLSTIQNGNYSLEEEAQYVIICRSGNRSQTASDLLGKSGYHIVNVSEGVSSWQGKLVK